MTTGAKTSCGGRSSGGLHDRRWDSMDNFERSLVVSKV